mgnify:FL=1
MSFTFNWNGFTVPQVQRQDYSQRAIDAAGMAGKAAAGYDRYVANQEYRDLVAGYGAGDRGQRYNELKTRLAELQKRQAEIATMIQV